MDLNDKAQLLSIIKSCLGTKFINRWSELACQIALDAVNTVTVEEGGRREIDIKRYAKVEKVKIIFELHYLFIFTIYNTPDSWWNHGRFVRSPWSNVEQRCDSPENAASHCQASHFAAGLQFGVQERREPSNIFQVF